jgi:hypothetical protein
VATPTSITIRGTYLRPDGTPDAGAITFDSSTFVRHGASDDVIAPGTLTATLDADGDVQLIVPATDDPAWSPVGWTYRVTVQLSGVRLQFDAAVPYDTPGGTLDLSELLPAQTGGEALYAALAHTHPDLSTDAETAAYVGAALAAYATDAELAAAVATRLALTGGTITGNVTVQGAGGTKSYGFRTNGSNLDLEASGADLFLSAWSDAGATGTQRNYLRLESGAALAHALGRWVFAAGAFDGTSVLDVDPAANTVTVDGILQVGTSGTVKFGDANDANVYRVGPGYIATDGKIAAGLDVECWDSGHGLVLHDRSNGNTYRLKVTAGVLGVEVV